MFASPLKSWSFGSHNSKTEIQPETARNSEFRKQLETWAFWFIQFRRFCLLFGFRGPAQQPQQLFFVFRLKELSWRPSDFESRVLFGSLVLWDLPKEWPLYFNKLKTSRDLVDFRNPGKPCEMVNFIFCHPFKESIISSSLTFIKASRGDSLRATPIHHLHGFPWSEQAGHRCKTTYVLWYLCFHVCSMLFTSTEKGHPWVNMGFNMF